MIEMIDRSLDIGIGILIIAVSSGFHEAAHAWAAYRCGDDTAKEMGRLTLNPMAHICLYNSIIVPAIIFTLTGIIFGGAKPVPIIPYKLRNPEKGLAFSAAAGPIANLLIAFVATILLLLTKSISINFTPNNLLSRFLINVVLINLSLAFFNLLPIPPLDGSRIARYFMPFLKDTYDMLDQMGIFLLFAIMTFIPGIISVVQIGRASCRERV